MKKELDLAETIKRPKEETENIQKLVDEIVNPEEYIISLDPGKFEVKAIGRNLKATADDIKRVCFRTKWYDLEKGYLEVENDKSYRIEYNGQAFIVGDQGEKKSSETSKTNDLHQICAYTAISQFLEPGSKKNRIYLVLACPLSVLGIEKAKDEYRNFIKGTGVISVNVDGNDYEFEIADVIIKAEGSGITYTNPEIFKNKTVGLIDIGGLNLGVSIYRNGSCKAADRYYDEFGAYQLTNYVAKDLTIFRDGNIVKDETAEKALEVGYLTDNGKPIAETIEIISTSKKRFFDDAVEKIEEKAGAGILSEVDSLVFVGGTTQKIAEAINAKFSHTYIAPKSNWATAEGLYKVACAYVQKRK